MAPSEPPDYMNERVFCRNRLPPRAHFLPTHQLLLSGRWKFHYTASPLAPEPSSDFAAAWSLIDVPGHWQLQGYGHPHYTNISYPFPTNPPFVPSENPTGLYETEFCLPVDWVVEGGLTYRLRFEGVDCAYHVWINGLLVGYSQGSRNAAEFDITNIIPTGKGSKIKVRVKVYQWSDGSYIEDQDMWWLSGIFRDVWLLAFPKEGHIEDFFVRTELDSEYRDAKLKIALALELRSAASLQFDLCDASGQSMASASDHECGRNATKHECVLDITNPLKWTAEHPNLYYLSVTLLLHGQKLQNINQQVGFRKIELQSGHIQVNGRQILFKGVNHHEHHPRFGRAVPLEFLRKDLLTMKQHNINALRCSHYPQDHRLLTLANELGLYVIDEADLECHGIGVAYDKLPSDDPAWKEAYVDRMQQLVHRDKNQPSVIMWSLGNESFFGQNHIAMYDWAKEYDPTRLIQYEGDHSGRVSDVYSYMYLSLSDLISLATKEGTKYDKPVILQEYGHSMGNGPGGLKEYKELFQKYPRLQGGFIWEWANHGLLKEIKDEPGKFFYAYGGDYGDIPNDGNFVMDGLCDSEHRPGPGLAQLKQIFQPISVMMNGPNIQINNLYDFLSLDDIEMQWTISRFSHDDQDECVESGKVALPYTKPGSEVVMHLPRSNSKPKLLPNVETWLHLLFRHRTKVLWAGPDHDLAWAQFRLDEQITAPNLPLTKSLQFPRIQQGSNLLTIITPTFTMTFDQVRAKLLEWSCKNHDMIAKNGGPDLTFWRAPTDNDRPRDAVMWKNYGLDRMTQQVRSVKHHVNDSGALEIHVESWIAPPVLAWGFQTSTTYTIYGDGDIRIHVRTYPKGDLPDTLPRIGLEMLLPPDRNVAHWFGLGPGQSYRDMKEAAKVGVWRRGVEDMMVPFEMPQENGNRTETRWVKAVNERGIGVKAILYRDSSNKASTPHSFEETPGQEASTQPQPSSSASPPLTPSPQEHNRKHQKSGFDFALSTHSALALERAQHPHELPRSSTVSSEPLVFRIDEDHHGLGTASCGPDAWEWHRLWTPKRVEFWVDLRAVGV